MQNGICDSTKYYILNAISLCTFKKKIQNIGKTANDFS